MHPVAEPDSPQRTATTRTKTRCELVSRRGRESISASTYLDHHRRDQHDWLCSHASVQHGQQVKLPLIQCLQQLCNWQEENADATNQHRRSEEHTSELQSLMRI